MSEVIFHGEDDGWCDEIDFIQNNDQLFLVNTSDGIVESWREVQNLFERKKR